MLQASGAGEEVALVDDVEGNVHAESVQVVARQVAGGVEQEPCWGRPRPPPAWRGRPTWTRASSSRTCGDPTGIRRDRSRTSCVRLAAVRISWLASGVFQCRIALWLVDEQDHQPDLAKIDGTCCSDSAKAMSRSAPRPSSAPGAGCAWACVDLCATASALHRVFQLGFRSSSLVDALLEIGGDSSDSI